MTVFVSLVHNPELVIRLNLMPRHVLQCVHSRINPPIQLHQILNHCLGKDTGVNSPTGSNEFRPLTISLQIAPQQTASVLHISLLTLLVVDFSPFPSTPLAPDAAQLSLLSALVRVNTLAGKAEPHR
jgi:hypothetical protein